MKKINLLLSGALTLALLNPASAFSAQTSGKVSSLPQDQQKKILQSLLSSASKDSTENMNLNMKSKNVDPKYSKLIESPSSLNLKTSMMYDADKNVCDFSNLNLGLTMNLPSSKLYNAYFNGSGWAEVQNFKDLGNVNLFFKITQLNPKTLSALTSSTSQAAQMMGAMLPAFNNKLFRISTTDILNMDPSVKKDLQPAFDAYKNFMGSLGTMNTSGLQKAYKPLLDNATYTVNKNKMNITFTISDFNKFAGDLISGLNLQEVLGGLSLAKGLFLNNFSSLLGIPADSGILSDSEPAIKNVKYTIELTNNVMTAVKGTFVASITEKVKENSSYKNVNVQYNGSLSCTISNRNVNITPKKAVEGRNITDIASMLK